MKNENYCEIFGSLEKLEQLSTIDKELAHGKLVFQSLSPFWGYYNDYPHHSSPFYIYMVIDKTYTVFEVMRAYQEVKAELGFHFDAAKAFVVFNDRSYNAIRLRQLDNFNQIQPIFESFAAHGIKPYSSSSAWTNVTARVTLNKLFCLEHIMEGIFIDKWVEKHAYIELPHLLAFDKLVELTNNVRNNWTETRFDAAVATFLKNDKVVSAVRIYSDNLEIENLSGLKKIYESKIGLV
jgi:hypothetical protein